MHLKFWLSYTKFSFYNLTKSPTFGKSNHLVGTLARNHSYTQRLNTSASLSSNCFHSIRVETVSDENQLELYSEVYLKCSDGCCFTGTEVLSRLSGALRVMVRVQREGSSSETSVELSWWLSSCVIKLSKWLILFSHHFSFQCLPVVPLSLWHLFVFFALDPASVISRWQQWSAAPGRYSNMRLFSVSV